VAGVLAFYGYTRSNLWLDEALTVNVARLPLRDLATALKHDGAPPLHYALLHVWMRVFGTGNVAVRSLSGLCMAGAVVVIYFVARRFAGREVGLLAAAVMAINPYAIRYATETRMYGLEILLVTLGILAVQRVVERPTWGRAAVFGVIVALLVYTQYWAFYLVPVVGALFVWMWYRNDGRVAATRLLVAGAVGLLAFVPWLPVFFYQRAHTGTPWGTPVLPGIPIGYTLRDFAGGASGTTADRQEGWLLFFVLYALLLLGVFARPTGDDRLEVDLRTQPSVRHFAFVGGAGLVVAVSLNYLAGSAFQSRYSAIVFPFFVLLVARGLSLLRWPRVLLPTLAVIVVLGAAGGVRNVITQRTQAGDVAAVLRADSKPGDVVVYCPDQLGPSVHRLAPAGLDEIVYPPSPFGPARVDWVDYKARVRATRVADVAADALRRAQGHTLWLVIAPGYITHTGICETLSDLLARDRIRIQRTFSNEKIFEKPAIQEFRARAGG
ncbi:MAG TPA: glycosyltransferase family 39 protein, partial [Acidimicrobiia bacterium]|nr:glycosyltransferase family 39 protein [Acidimicrobiia bacterium]